MAKKKKEEGGTEVIFMTRYPNQKLTMSPPRSIKDGMHVQIIPGRFIQFQDEMFKTSDPEEIEFLRKHRFYGHRIREIDPRSIAIAAGKIVTIPCGFVMEDGDTCDFVAEGKDGAEADKILRGHRTKCGHWPEDDDLESDSVE